MTLVIVAAVAWIVWAFIAISVGWALWKVCELLQPPVRAREFEERPEPEPERHGAVFTFASVDPEISDIVVRQPPRGEG